VLQIFGAIKKVLPSSRDWAETPIYRAVEVCHGRRGGDF